MAEGAEIGSSRPELTNSQFALRLVLMLILAAVLPVVVVDLGSWFSNGQSPYPGLEWIALFSPFFASTFALKSQFNGNSTSRIIVTIVALFVVLFVSFVSGFFGHCVNGDCL